MSIEEKSMNQTMTLNLPGDLYVRIKKCAEEAHRSIEEETVARLETSLPAPSDEPFKQLEMLDNAGLEAAARSHLLPALAEELESLHFKQQREGLTAAESARCAELVRAYEKAMLTRAHAAVLLKKRGVDIGHLIAQP
jgi:hypothetical protein